MKEETNVHFSSPNNYFVLVFDSEILIAAIAPQDALEPVRTRGG